MDTYCKYVLYCGGPCFEESIFLRQRLSSRILKLLSLHRWQHNSAVGARAGRGVPLAGSQRAAVRSEPAERALPQETVRGGERRWYRSAGVMGSQNR